VRLPVWLTSARGTIDEAIAAESSRQQQEVASDAQAALNDHLDELTALAIAVQVGQAAGWLVDIVVDPRGAGAGPAVDALIAKGPRRAEVNRLQTALPVFVQEARRTVGAAWLARIRDQVGGLSDLKALVGVLDQIPDSQDRQAALKKALQSVTELTDTLPTPASETKLASVGAEVDAAFRNAFGDAEVREFLLAASRSGASLGQLTPTVRAWIEENGAANLMRVSIGPMS
jgi:hypothetical protein